MRLNDNQFGLNRADFESYADYRKEYIKLYHQTDSYKERQKKGRKPEHNDKYNKSEKGKLAAKRYRQSVKGRGLFNAKTVKYRASKMQRTPKWSQLEQIKQFYIECPKGYDVDHIVPLQGERVSGLHVLENLQYLPASENRSKRNTF